tara:strand:+ start:614 stop:805 length:192 start_codon:yes stop_codon:yes gene_type:complete
MDKINISWYEDYKNCVWCGSVTRGLLRVAEHKVVCGRCNLELEKVTPLEAEKARQARLSSASG